MFRNPKKTIQAINNCVTVALPLTSLEIDYLLEKMIEKYGTPHLDTLEDVDFSNHSPTDGDVLIYSDDNEKWVASRQLFNQHMDAGEY